MKTILNILSAYPSTLNNNHAEAIADCIYAANCGKTALIDHLFIWSHATDVDSVEDKEYKDMIQIIKQELKGEIVNVEV